jgi:hypothetical protein
MKLGDLPAGIWLVTDWRDINLAHVTDVRDVSTSDDPEAGEILVTLIGGREIALHCTLKEFRKVVGLPNVESDD